MRTEAFANIGSLMEGFNSLSLVYSWEKEGVTPTGLNHLIKNNLRLIMAQTENPNTAPRLKGSLLALSARIEKEFNNPTGRAYSDHDGGRFRRMAGADSDAWRGPIPTHGGGRFRRMTGADSDA